MIHTGTGNPSSSTQSPSTTATSSSSRIPTIAQPPQRSWINPRAVRMAAPLHLFPTHPKKWLPKFNPDNGLLDEEHINNFMLSINLNEVVEEDVVVRLFPYTLQGPRGSQYFSLPSGSINSWDAFQEKFLTKFGYDRSTATQINDLSNLKVEPKEPIKDFNSRFNKLLNKMPSLVMRSKMSGIFFLSFQTHIFSSIRLTNQLWQKI